MTNSSFCLSNPMAIPATGRRILTPASIRARALEQTVAMELEPFDSSTSATIRIV